MTKDGNDSIERITQSMLFEHSFREGLKRDKIKATLLEATHIPS